MLNWPGLVLKARGCCKGGDVDVFEVITSCEYSCCLIKVAVTNAESSFICCGSIAEIVNKSYIR